MTHVARTMFLIGLVVVLGASAASPQGRCMTTYGSAACNTGDIPAVFAPTAWRTVALEHVTFQVADYSEGQAAGAR